MNIGSVLKRLVGRGTSSSDYMTPAALQTQVGLQASDAAKPPFITFKEALKTALGIKPPSEAKQVTDQRQNSHQDHFRPQHRPKGNPEPKAGESGDSNPHLDIRV